MIIPSEFLLAPGVYKFTCTVNNKIYIGESLEISYRFAQHKSACTDTYFHRAIKKHGWENFEVEILQEYKIPKNELAKVEMDLMLLALETAFIDFFDATNPNVGYNVLKFGFNRTGVLCSEEAKIKHSEAIRGEKNVWFGKKLSEETKKKMSEAQKTIHASRDRSTYIYPMKGKKHTEETKAKMSFDRKGEKSHWLGKKWSEESKKKLSDSRKGKYTGINSPMFGKHLSEEAKQKISLANTGRVCDPELRKKISESMKNLDRNGAKNPMYGKTPSQETINKMVATKASRAYDYSYCSKSIQQIDKNTNEVIKVWDSAEQASKELKVSSSHITNVCRKQKDSSGYTYQTAKGFKWEYVPQQP